MEGVLLGSLGGLWVVYVCVVEDDVVEKPSCCKIIDHVATRLERVCLLCSVIFYLAGFVNVTTLG